MKYREVERKLRKLGCDEVTRHGGGSHRKWYNPSTGGGAILPDWGKKDLKKGTLRNGIKQLGLDWEEFKKA